MKRTTTQIRTAASNYDRLFNEGGEGYNPHRAELQAQQPTAAEYAAWLQASATAAKAAEEAEWTQEITQERRQAWNAWVRQSNGKLAPNLIANQIKAQGWNLDALKRAITRHGM